MTRSEHIAWCKSRAREYLRRGDPVDAVASMVSDLTKHEETKKLAESTAFMVIWSAQSMDAATRFVEGFTE